MGWIVVEFPEPREVFVGGDSQGDNRTAAGEYNAFSVGDGSERADRSRRHVFRRATRFGLGLFGQNP